MVAHITYAKTLIAKGHGYPLWEPDPGGFAPVELASVGYLSDGGFVHLFNSAKDITYSHNQFGLPDCHTPLHVGAVRRRIPLPKAPEFISSNGVVEAGASVSVTTGYALLHIGKFEFHRMI